MTLRIGMIGTGFARRVQLPAMTLVPDVEVTAIASGRRGNADATAREFGIATVFDDGEALARSTSVDAVIVSSTPDTHARFAIAALETGKHVLCEKPTALSASEAAAMRDAAARHPDRLAWMDHELRYEPNRCKVRDLIRAGAIGEIEHLELVLRPYLRGDGRPQAADAPWNWWFDRAKGGGILGAVGSHLIDLCRFWTGREVTWAAGNVATFVTERTDERGVRHPVTADEYASCVLQLGGGAFATLTLTTAAHHGSGHWGQITGREGTLVLSGETKLELGKPGGALTDASVADELWERTKPNNMWARSFVRLLRDFAAAAQGAAPAGEPATFTDGWKIQRVLDAVRAGTAARLD